MIDKTCLQIQLRMKLILLYKWDFEDVPFMKGGGLMKIGFVGAGKVGFSLGKYMTEHGVSVSGYYSKNIDSAREASEFTDTKYDGSM